MSDIVTRLRGEVAWEPDVGELMSLAAAEIERLESRLRFADAAIRSGDVAALTVDERAAITEASDFYVGTRTGVTLISLMKRMGCER